MEVPQDHFYIRTEKLGRVFRTDEVETMALDRVSLGVKTGEFLAVMGPSGCGKSTLLNILGLLDHPTSGSLFFNGEDVTGLREKERSARRKGKIGYIFQNFNLIGELNIFDNIEMPLVFMKFGSRERRKRVWEVMERLKISHRSDHYPGQLSGGQQQRVAICRALAFNPQLLLADEPTGNLDSKNGAAVMDLLGQVNREGTTIIMVTHSERNASHAHRVVRMFDGTIVSGEGATTEPEE